MRVYVCERLLSRCMQIDIVVDRLLITLTKTKQTNPIPKNDESLMSSANSI